MYTESALTGALCTCSVHCKYTHWCTGHGKCTLWANSPLHCARIVYTLGVHTSTGGARVEPHVRTTIPSSVRKLTSENCASNIHFAPELIPKVYWNVLQKGRRTVYSDYTTWNDHIRDGTFPINTCCITPMPITVTISTFRWDMSQVAPQWYSNPPHVPPLLHLISHVMRHCCRPERAPAIRNIQLKLTHKRYCRIQVFILAVQSARWYQCCRFCWLNISR